MAGIANIEHKTGRQIVVVPLIPITKWEHKKVIKNIKLVD